MALACQNKPGAKTKGTSQGLSGNRTLTNEMNFAEHLIFFALGEKIIARVSTFAKVKTNHA